MVFRRAARNVYGRNEVGGMGHGGGTNCPAPPAPPEVAPHLGVA